MNIKTLVVNLTLNKQNVLELPFKPFVGDKIPVNYINEKVTEVVITTPLVKSELKIEGHNLDLIIYTE